MMPSISKKQHNFMEAVAHNAAFAKKAGVPQSVGKDFATADKGKKFAKGGLMATKKMMMKKMAKGGDTTGMSANKQSKGITKEAMGKVRTAAPSKDGIAEKGRTKGMQVKMSGNSIGNGPMVNTGMKRGGMAKKK